MTCVLVWSRLYAARLVAKLWVRIYFHLRIISEASKTNKNKKHHANILTFDESVEIISLLPSLRNRWFRWWRPSCRRCRPAPSRSREGRPAKGEDSFFVSLFVSRWTRSCLPWRPTTFLLSVVARSWNCFGGTWRIFFAGLLSAFCVPRRRDPPPFGPSTTVFASSEACRLQSARKANWY